MENFREKVTFEASFYAESEKSFAVLVVKGDSNGDTWNTLEWFPKSLCSMSNRVVNKVTVTAPRWILKEKKIVDKITQVKK